MDRSFLDANVLFSAAYRQDAKLRKLWRLKNTKLISSGFAIEEARRNLAATMRTELNRLITSLEIITLEYNDFSLLGNIKLRDKDKPILLAALIAKANYLITGDFRDFGQYFGKNIKSITIIPPSDYLKNQQHQNKPIFYTIPA